MLRGSAGCQSTARPPSPPSPCLGQRGLAQILRQDQVVLQPVARGFLWASSSSPAASSSEIQTQIAHFSARPMTLDSFLQIVLIDLAYLPVLVEALEYSSAEGLGGSGLVGISAYCITFWCPNASQERFKSLDNKRPNASKPGA